jgi:hypothetical protein
VLVSLAVHSLVALSAAQVAQDEPIKVLVVTGGHGFEEEPFFAIFKSMEGIRFETAEQKQTSEAYDRDLTKYDVLVLYDMPQKITDSQKMNLFKFLAAGKGIVALHHCLGSYQDWPEFQKVIGGKFYTAERTEEGVTHPVSTWKHDVRFTVNIADEDHPIVRELSDFEILDEVYNNYLVRPEVKPLLTVDHPLSGKVIAWTHVCGKAPVAYILLAHGPSGYNNPNYRKLVANAIRWAAGRLPAQKPPKPAPAAAPLRGSG